MPEPPPEDDTEIQIHRQDPLIFEVLGRQGRARKKGSFSMSIAHSDRDHIGTT